MRRLARFVVSAVFASLAAAAFADDLILSDGTSHACEILAVNENSVLARGKLKTGQDVELKIPVDKLDPDWFYARRDAVPGLDAKARVQFAGWCVDNGMFSKARLQVHKALVADPKLLEELSKGKYAEIREGLAMRALANAEADIAAGRLEPAREKLEVILGRLSDTAAGDKARNTMRTLAAKQAEAEAKKEAEANAKLEEKRTKLLAPVDEDYRKGREQALEGLTEDNHGKALDLMENALSRGESAIKRLDVIEKDKDNAGDKVLLTAAAERRTKTTAGMVKIRIHRADLYIWRGSLPNAKQELDAARKLDPTNTAIDAAMQRLLNADEDDEFERRVYPEQRTRGSRFRSGGVARR